MKPAFDVIIFAGWTLFGVYWLISAFRVKRTAERQSLLSMLAHRIPIGLAAFLLAFQQWPSSLNRAWLPRMDWMLALGAAVCLFGLFVTLWARWTLAGNWSSDVTFKQNHELVDWGPYRFARHPIYTGLFVMVLGTALESGRVHCWLAVPVVLIGFWIKLKQEEALLLRHFPNEYPPYRKRVKALLPFLI